MEDFNWTILAWVAGLIFVYFFGIFEGRSQGRKRRIAEEEQEKKEKKEKPASEPVKVDDPGMLRIKNEGGTMTLDLDGKRVNATALNSQQRKRLIEMLNVMRPWLEGKPASVPAPTNPPPPKPTPASAPIASSPPRSAAQPTPSSPAKSSSSKTEDEPDSTPTSIVGQINQILQKQIDGTTLEARGVSLMESASGGVNVYVGVQRYEMIDDVPDEEIKAAIRAAIAEWENKYTPGL